MKSFPQVNRQKPCPEHEKEPVAEFAFCGRLLKTFIYSSGLLDRDMFKYCADYDGQWGEIQFDLVEGTAQIVKLAEWDRTNSQPFARKLISFILRNSGDDLPKKLTIPFELHESGGRSQQFWGWQS